MSRKRISRSRKCRNRSRRPSRPHPFSRQPKDEQLPYARRDALLSRGELAFFRTLSRAVAFRHGISMKTRLADVVRCPPEHWDTIHGRRLSQKHVDFVIYDRYTAAIIAVVELDDRSHNAKGRRDRDAFVDHVLGGLGVAIIRVRAASTYSVDALRLRLDPKNVHPSEHGRSISG